MQLETIGEELRSALATDAVDYTAMRARSLAGAFFFDRDGRVSGCVVLVNHRAQACPLRRRCASTLCRRACGAGPIGAAAICAAGESALR